jgi:hypothetical protein
MWSKIMPPDVIAVLTVVVCGVLLGMGKDSIVAAALVAVVSGYYGLELSPLGKFTRRNKDKRR